MTQNFLEECLKICGKSRWMSNLLFGKFPKYGRKSVEKTNSHNYCLMLVVFEWLYCELQNVKFLNLTSRWQRRTLRHIDKLIYIYKVCFTCKFWHLLRGMWIISTYTHTRWCCRTLYEIENDCLLVCEKKKQINSRKSTHNFWIPPTENDCGDWMIAIIITDEKSTYKHVEKKNLLLCLRLACFPSFIRSLTQSLS